jgi:hypothetical protein
MLLVMSPAIERSTGRAVLLIYMWIPLYMVHQYEEYVLSDFLAWIRRAMPRNAAFLTVRKVLIINLGFVWLLYVLSFYAARAGNAVVALYAPYLAGVLFRSHPHGSSGGAWRRRVGSCAPDLARAQVDS